MTEKITTIFTDIGGVLLTNGWDHVARKIAVEQFALDAAETEDRHHLVYDTYESGRMTLDEYLDYLVFYEPRSFSKNDFKNYMFSYSRPFDDMIALMKEIKARFNLKIVAINNEGKEINQYRIDTFGLNHFIDCFVSSCFVSLRKPDVAMYQLAINMAQTPLNRCVYIDDRPVLAGVAQKLGLNGIVHVNYMDTKKILEQLLN